MNQVWSQPNLGNLCDVLDSKRIPITERDREKGIYPYYGASGILDYVNDYIFDEKLILLGEDGAKWGAGEKSAFITEGKCWVNNHAHVLRPNRTKVIDNWLVYFLNFSDLTKYTTGLTVPKLNQEKMRSITIPLPPLDEQLRIVAILDEAFAAIDKARENTERNLRNARELFESYLESVFANPGAGWEEKKLGEISKIKYGYTEKATYAEIGPNFLRITDIQNNTVNWDSVPFCSIETSEFSKYKLLDGDIVFARTGATTGKSFLISNPPKAVFASYLIKVQVQDTNKFIPKFIQLFFQTKTYWDKINIGKSGSTQGGFNASKLTELLIPLPSKQDQISILAKTDVLSAETKKLEAIYHQKLVSLDDLKKSLLQKAFNGEL